MSQIQNKSDGPSAKSEPVHLHQYQDDEGHFSLVRYDASSASQCSSKHVVQELSAGRLGYNNEWCLRLIFDIFVRSLPLDER